MPQLDQRPPKDQRTPRNSGNGGDPNFNWRGLILLAAALILIAGAIFMPLGISKIRATPTWSGWSIGASVLMIAARYWICDIKRHTAWAFFLIPAGSNTLLTYLLPDLWYFVTVSLGLTYLDTHFVAGSPGVVKTLIFTAVMLALAWACTRAKLRLQL